MLLKKKKNNGARDDNLTLLLPLGLAILRTSYVYAPQTRRIKFVCGYNTYNSRALSLLLLVHV